MGKAQTDPRLSSFPTSRAVGMARLLLILEVWKSNEGRPIEAGRLAVMDFSLRFPTVVGRIVSSLEIVAEAYGLADEGLSELFASRHFLDLRETIVVLAHGLYARGLVDDETPDLRGDVGYSISSLGEEISGKMVGALSWGYRSMAAELMPVWRRSSVPKIFQEIRSHIPVEADQTSSLRRPFFLGPEA